MSPSHTPPRRVQIHDLKIKEKFDGLSENEKRYAHYMARAAWHGTRIVLRQVSPEAIGIFDFILEAYSECDGNWDKLIQDKHIEPEQLNAFLLYAATFLSNAGNYYGSGDQKFVPEVDSQFFKAVSLGSKKLTELYDRIADGLFSVPPYSLGYPSNSAQSAYYPGADSMTVDEIAEVSKALEQRSIWPENTRIRKVISKDDITYVVLQASIKQSTDEQNICLENSNTTVHLKGGDHSEELKKICAALLNAAPDAANDTQRAFLAKYIASFQTGSLDQYRDSLRDWVTDKNPKIENIFGFVEPYRDPYGIRAEFEGLVGISDAEETKILYNLAENSDKFIKRLPWVPEGCEGKGPFEKSLFEPPNFSSIHTLAYCSSIIFPGINLPNYNDIRQECNFKNIIIANRMVAESSPERVSPFVDPSEVETFQRHKYPAYYWWVVLHELLGHGTGKMLVEEEVGKYNFDIESPPINPLTGSPISSWYKPGETWTGQFGDLATTVDECRAELVGAYLLDDTELLALFGFTDETDITAAQITYNMYMQLGTDGLRGLANFNIEDGKWGQAHSRAHFAILKCLLQDGGGVITIETDLQRHMLSVKLNESKILTYGKAALGKMLLRLHVYRCTAQVSECRAYYEELTKVDGEYLKWRDIVIANKLPPLLYVQPNTFVEGDSVSLREYDSTCEGIIKSWAERLV